MAQSQQNHPDPTKLDRIEINLENLQEKAWSVDKHYNPESMSNWKVYNMDNHDKNPSLDKTLSSLFAKMLEKNWGIHTYNK